MWRTTVQTKAPSGRRVRFFFETFTRGDAVAVLKQLGTKFKPTDFFGRSDDYDESEGMLTEDYFAIYVTLNPSGPDSSFVEYDKEMLAILDMIYELENVQLPLLERIPEQYLDRIYIKTLKKQVKTIKKRLPLQYR